MSHSYKALFNRRLEAHAASDLSMRRENANKQHRSLAMVLLAASFSLAASTALADQIIDNGAVLNVSSGPPFDAAGFLVVGYSAKPILSAPGLLNITGGGEVTNDNAWIGYQLSSEGQVSVSGTGSKWTSSFLIIGNDGSAFVMVDDGASIISVGGTVLANSTSSFAQVTLSGDIIARGLFSTPSFWKGYGMGMLLWDGGILQASSDDADFLSGFDVGDIVIDSNGAFFDTNGHNVGFSEPNILIGNVGNGGFTKLGAGTLTIAGDNSWDSDTTVTAGTLTLLGNYLQDGSQILTIGVAGSANYGKLNVIGTATFNNGNLAVDVIGSPVLANNMSLAGVITAGALTTPVGGFIVTDNSALFDFAATVNGNAVDLNVSASGSTGTTVYRSVLDNRLYPALGAASVLDTQVQGAPTGDMANVVTAFGQLPDARSVARAAAQTLPLNAGAEATLETLGTINSIFASRFAPGHAGMPSGDMAANRQVWITPLGFRAVQNDTDNNASGYDANTWGLAAGIEGDIGKTQVGVAYAYARTHLDGNADLSGAGTSAEIDSNVVAVYGSHPIDDMALGFQVDAGWNNTDSERILDFGGLNRSASGSYDSWNLHAGGNLSRAIVLDHANTFIPALRADYTRLRSQSYAEQGAGALNLDVEASTVEALTLGLDGRIVHVLSPNAQLEAIVGVSYDAINDDGDLTASYAGLPGQSFLAAGIDRSPWLARAGMGYTYSLDGGADISLRYDAGWRDDYLRQSVSFKAAWSF